MRYKIKQSIYPIQIFLLLNDRAMKDDEDGLCVRYDDNSIEIHVRVKRDYDRTISILIHELIHLIDDVEEIIGSELSSEGKAYFVQYIAAEMIPKIRRYHGRYFQTSKLQKQ